MLSRGTYNRSTAAAVPTTAGVAGVDGIGGLRERAEEVDGNGVPPAPPGRPSTESAAIAAVAVAAGAGVPSAAAGPAPIAPLPTPATHAYLGEATTGSALTRKDLEVGSTVEMPILSLPGVVLFPGESLPLRLHNPAYAMLAESLLGAGAVAGGGDRGGRGGGESSERQAARHLGVVNRLKARAGGLLVRTSPVGTTAEIRSGHGGSAGEDADGSGGGGGLAVMARGRHRFRLVEDLGWRRGVRYWKVAISLDLCPGPLRPPIPRAFRDFPGPARGGGGRGYWAMATPRFVVDANSPAGLAERAASLLREQREPLIPDDPPPAAAPRAEAAAVVAATVTVERNGPGGVAEAAAEVFVRRRKLQGVGSGEEGGADYSSSEEEEAGGGGRLVSRRRGKLDPTLFSFWLAANLPLDDEARQELLMLDSVVMRLRLEVKHLEKSRRRALCCAGCGTGIAWEGDVFTLPGAEGVVGAYVNPMGYVHQASMTFYYTVTVRDARNLVLVGTPEEEHSWFPGYAWTLAYCEGCPDHLGWHFTAIDHARRGGQQQCQRGQEHHHHHHQQQQQQQLHSVLSTPPLSSLSPSSLPASPAAFFGLRRPSLVNAQEMREL
ncbi:unnamed protein product [Pylaiella littoralis]